MRRALTSLVLCASITPAIAQSVNYKSLDVTAGVASQVDYYATAKKDCSAAPPPSIKVVTVPKHGMLTVRRGTVTTNKIPSCPNLQTAVNVILYTGNAGFAGDDEIVYEVTDAKGEVTLYNIKVTVKEGSKPSEPLPSQKPEQRL